MVNRRTGHLVDGHLRVEEALSHGQPAIPVLYVDLCPDEERIVLASLEWAWCPHWWITSHLDEVLRPAALPAAR